MSRRFPEPPTSPGLPPSPELLRSRIRESTTPRPIIPPPPPDAFVVRPFRDAPNSGMSPEDRQRLDQYLNYSLKILEGWLAERLASTKSTSDALTRHMLSLERNTQHVTTVATRTELAVAGVAGDTAALTRAVEGMSAGLAVLRARVAGVEEAVGAVMRGNEGYESAARTVSGFIGELGGLMVAMHEMTVQQQELIASLRERAAAQREMAEKACGTETGEGATEGGEPGESQD
ncbi:hypothetical protein GLOTRDRAFT_129886 [Gloeophyllum trabeum ATCC 11539]|uniref:Uncharacterized protein n=1 Tax=Gloeophyllum trabeum (strain ATCC 11539 / FP-39264 / Madison 617) TaxID=670483 RepID=S7Q3H0_GLOTA|nr:uncharacterized protein GLOTRDRAFT_129886 [Gloeophyllum trabeum ATCC 11539]EPQ54526.1 hypothetical protein GLOTRDRAFT_129886 [Gloeophyllum trabeum ATCC 11539]